MLPVEARLQLLELFRPEVHFVCAHLERHFLNQAIVLDERPRKIANLCQALQNHLAIGYKLIVVQEAPRNSRDRAQLLAVGIQRAIRSLCGPLIRASQLYCPVPEGFGWNSTSCTSWPASAVCIVSRCATNWPSTPPA